MGRKRNSRVTKWKNEKNTVITKQSSSAVIKQGGNAFAINASEVGVVKIRPGR